MEPHSVTTGRLVGAHDEKVTSLTGSPSLLPIQMLHDVGDRALKRESTGPLCAGSLALFVNDQPTDPKRNHHAYE